MTAGDNSTAGGFVSDNSPGSGSQTPSCVDCFTGDGFNNSAAITNAQASGGVTVGASSVAGGFAAIGGGNHGQSGGSFTNVSAAGAVNVADNSIVGGLVGVLSEGGTLANSKAQNTLVASSGANSVVGGIVGVNEGSISDTTSTAPVSGTSDSYIGGVTGINLGSITGSSSDPDISGSGGDNFVGGIAGLNVGTIDNSTGLVALSSGSPNYAGGAAGVNAAYGNSAGTIPNSSFPIGTITNSSATGSGFTDQVGTTSPSFIPGLPAWLAGCTDAACTTLTGGSVQLGTTPVNNPSSPGSPNTVPTDTAFANQQVLTFTQQASLTPANIAPPLVDPATVNTASAGPNGNPGNGPGNNGVNGNNGNSGTLANGRQGGNGAPPGMRLVDMRVMPLPPGTGLPPPGETRFLPTQVVMQFGAGMTPQQVAALAQRFGLTVVAQQTIGAFGRTVYTFQINNGRSVAAVIQAIDNAELNAAAQPNYTYGLSQDRPGSAADLGDPAQYVVSKLQLGAVHRITQGKDVVVAVINSRVDTKQPDFAGRIVDYYDAGCGPDTPPDAHGTGMAGAIASHIGLLGVAPNARIIAICAFGGTGKPEATSAKIISGVDYAIAHGAKIINMSFAGPRDPALAQELQIAREKGILIIAAAGNAGPKSPPLYPGADPNVMAVTATDEHDRLFAGANQGNYVTVAAPGVNILVPAPSGDVQFTTGTSVASAECQRRRGVAACGEANTHAGRDPRHSGRHGQAPRSQRRERAIRCRPGRSAQGAALRAARDQTRIHRRRLRCGCIERRAGPSQPHIAQAQRVADHRNGAQAHRRRGDDRAQQQAESRIEHAGGDRNAEHVVDEREERDSAGCCASSRGSSARARDARQVALDQRDAGALHRDVGAGAHRDADVGLGQRRRVVDAVARHRDDAAFALQPPDDRRFSVGQHLGFDLRDAELARRPPRRWFGCRRSA